MSRPVVLLLIAIQLATSVAPLTAQIAVSETSENVCELRMGQFDPGTVAPAHECEGCDVGVCVMSTVCGVSIVIGPLGSADALTRSAASLKPLAGDDASLGYLIAPPLSPPPKA